MEEAAAWNCSNMEETQEVTICSLQKPLLKKPSSRAKLLPRTTSYFIELIQYAVTAIMIEVCEIMYQVVLYKEKRKYF
jgi:hypothetical protein